jgi:fibronectin-binding autotransporter adhesin
MKRVILISMIAIGLAQSSWASAVGNLLWYPSTAPSPSSTWDTSSANWYDTNLTSNVAFAQGDSVIFDDSDNTYSAVTLSGVLNPSNVVVTATWFDYSLGSTSGGKLTNVCSLTKKGYGALVLDADCVITNAIVIEEGTLQVGNGAARGTLGSGAPGYTAPITNNGTLALFRGTSTVYFFSNNLSGPGALFSTNTGGANAAIHMRGTNTMTGTLIASGGIIGYKEPWTFGSPSDIYIIASTNNARLQFSNNIVVSCPIVVSNLSGDLNTRASLMSFAGTNTINGNIRISGNVAANTAWLGLYGQGAGHQELNVNGSISDYDSGNPFNGRLWLRGTSTAGICKLYGTINLPAAQLFKDDVGTWTIYSGGNSAASTVLGASAPTTAAGRLNLAAANALPQANLTLNTATLDLGGFDQRIGALNGDPAATGGIITNSSTTSDSLLTIIAYGGNYYGSIKDSGSTGKIGVKILNPGSPTTEGLYGTCTYSGATILDFATAIALGNSGLPNSTPIEMGNGSTIDLINKTDHTFTLGAAQTLKADGTVHVNGNLVNQGTIECKIGKSGTVVSSDQVVVSSQLIYGGTLKLDLSGDALNASDSLKLFTATNSYSGAFSSIDPTTPSGGYAWNTNTLTADGTLRIFSTSQPTVSSEVVSSGTQLHLAWPTDHTGWVLQSQTNAVGGLTTNWHDVPGSSLSNEIYIPIDQANQSVFYRLVYQP